MGGVDRERGQHRVMKAGVTNTAHFENGIRKCS